MKKTVLFFAAAAAMMLAGCNEQEFATPELTEAKTINLVLEATRGEVPQTRTLVGYNDEYASLESTWSAGDVIYVYSKKSGNQIGTLTQNGAITNQKSSATAQYSTSYTFFTGSLTLGEGDKLTDDYAFVYQGAGRTLTAAEGLLTYEMGTSDGVAGLNAWDIAYATGKIQGTAADASCAVSFSNKMAFGYFSTEGLTGDISITNYYGGFTLDVKTGTVKGVSAKFKIPAGKKFYMPLIAGSTVNMGSDKAWSAQGGKLGYANISQSTSFTASAGGYYRLGRNAEFGPVKFEEGDWTCYETLKNSTFNVGTAETPKMVHFTQGNLQYIGSAKNESGDAAPYWRLAETQYSYLGNLNYKPSAAEVGNSGTKMPEDADTDFFGWGEANPPFLCSTVNDDYQPGIDKANMELPADANWATKFNGNNRTLLYIEQGKEYTGIEGEQYIVLSSKEWQNLFKNQWYCGATVTLKNGTTVKGVVVCPSDMDETEAKNLLGENARKNDKTPTALYDECALDQSTVDEKGLLFLPAAGYRYGTSVSNVGSYGYYWSTTSSSATLAYRVRFYATYFNSAYSVSRYNGFSVRLASAVPTPAPVE